jgi:hypothetical protein
MEKIILTRSERNKEIVIFENHIYNFHSLNNETKRWRCKIRKCSGVLFTNNLNEVITKKPHNHDAISEEEEKLLLLRKIDIRVMNSYENLTSLLAIELSKTDDTLLKKMPHFSSLRDKATRMKNKNKAFLKPDYEDFPECLKVTLNGQKFLQYDSGVNDPIV